jgi:hypothetical protein
VRRLLLVLVPSLLAFACASYAHLRRPKPWLLVPNNLPRLASAYAPDAYLPRLKVWAPGEVCLYDLNRKPNPPRRAIPVGMRGWFMYELAARDEDTIVEYLQCCEAGDRKGAARLANSGRLLYIQDQPMVSVLGYSDYGSTDQVTLRSTQVRVLSGPYRGVVIWVYALAIDWPPGTPDRDRYMPSSPPATGERTGRQQARRQNFFPDRPGLWGGQSQ